MSARRRLPDRRVTTVASPWSGRLGQTESVSLPPSPLTRCNGTRSRHVPHTMPWVHAWRVLAKRLPSAGGFYRRFIRFTAHTLPFICDPPSRPLLGKQSRQITPFVSAPVLICINNSSLPCYGSCFVARCGSLKDILFYSFLFNNA